MGPYLADSGPMAGAAFVPIVAVLTSLCLQAFDELHLLKRGGKTIYTGPTGRESAELISYFEAIPGVPHIQPGMNPATWMLGEPPQDTLQMQV